MGFYQQVIENFGEEAKDTLHNISKTMEKVVSLKNRKIFLLKCRQKNLTPRHIQQNIRCLWPLLPQRHPYIHMVDQAIKQFKKSILNIEIKITFWEISVMNNNLCTLKERANDLLPNDIIMNFLFNQRLKCNRLFEEYKRRQIRKLKQLEQRQNSVYELGQDDWIENLSDKEVPNSVKNILSLGPKFTIDYNRKDIPIKRIVTDAEYCISKQELSEDMKNEKRLEVTNIITNHMIKNKNNQKINKIDTDFKETKCFLKDNDDLLVTKSDKGNKTVLLKKDDYVGKMNELLDDRRTYETLNNDPTVKFQNKNNKLVKKLFEQGYIDEREKKKLTIYNSRPPLAYGLPKIHKENIPLRPVISQINSPSYHLAKFISNILNNLNPELHYNVKNSFSFVEKIQQIKLPDGYVLLSLDVKSLFTNVSKEAVKDSLKKHWNSITVHTNIPQNIFLELVDFCFDSSYFSFNNSFYMQNFGTAMGNPASPIFANIVLHDLISTCLDRLPLNIPFLFLYVDDILLSAPEDCIDVILNEFNAFDNYIQFTVEKEENNRIPFLDVMLIREGENVLTEWYRKSINSNRILNFYSSHPLNQKVAIIKSMKFKIEKLCSNEFQERNFHIAKNILINNNYPENLIHTIFADNRPRITNTTPENNIKYYKLPFVNGLSQNLKRCLENENNVRVTFYNDKSLGSLFNNNKDKLPVELKSNVIYQIPCDCGKQYIGQTKQWLGSRIKNHKYDIKNKKTSTALSNHVVEQNCKFNFDQTKILDTEHNLDKRLLLEMMYINCNKDCVNVRTDVDNLSTIYKSLLNKFT